MHHCVAQNDRLRMSRERSKLSGLPVFTICHAYAKLREFTLLTTMQFHNMIICLHPICQIRSPASLADMFTAQAFRNTKSLFAYSTSGLFQSYQQTTFQMVTNHNGAFPGTRDEFVIGTLSTHIRVKTKFGLSIFGLSTCNDDSRNNPNAVLFAL